MIFSTAPLGHVASMAASMGLSVDSAGGSVKAECSVSKWGTAELLHSSDRNHEGHLRPHTFNVSEKRHKDAKCLS